MNKWMMLPVLAAGIGMSACAIPTDAQSTPVPTVTIYVTQSPEAQPEPEASKSPKASPKASPVQAKGQVVLDPGTWLVGSEAPAGRYRTVNNVGDLCYLAQVDKSGEIMENDVATVGRPVFVVKAVKGSTFEIHEECGPMVLMGTNA